ncbi:hypothetical protein SAMN02746089_01905 [Caldanaerobius fijiensis DSM 17918]|uniref:Type II secretory pathway, pseudopilin PulG n=1 Tax=Caldanaerobius fijiensis DSM 17918 TaxID=1121256 RepID=A0A1M5BL54_9THEO|nr:hypothetical protein [Caldanaerobius fijiensis]SHF43261.1 hypothetical protein SAMN02746089_01905 [Caldanaerobius fijiensis DSM 17918]
MRNLLKNEEGFSFINALTATSIVVLCVLFLSSMITYGTRMNRLAVNRTKALFLAQEELDTILSQKPAPVMMESSVPIPGYPGFYRSIKVRETAYGSIEITVTISFPNGNLSLTVERSE